MFQNLTILINKNRTFFMLRKYTQKYLRNTARNGKCTFRSREIIQFTETAKYTALNTKYTIPNNADDIFRRAAGGLNIFPQWARERRRGMQNIKINSNLERKFWFWIGFKSTWKLPPPETWEGKKEIHPAIIFLQYSTKQYMCLGWIGFQIPFNSYFTRSALIWA